MKPYPEFLRARAYPEYQLLARAVSLFLAAWRVWAGVLLHVHSEPRQPLVPLTPWRSVGPGERVSFDPYGLHATPEPDLLVR